MTISCVPRTFSIARKGAAGVRKIDGGKITRLRKQKGWDQYELAAAANIAPSVVSRLERNLQADFKLSVVDAVATALNVSIDALLEPRTRSESADIALELQAALDQLRMQSGRVQRHVAGIINGYLAALDEEP